MIEKYFAEVPSLGKVIREIDLAPEGDVTAELMPSGQAGLDGLTQRLVQGHHHLQLVLSCLHRISLRVENFQQIVNRDRIPGEQR